MIEICRYLTGISPVVLCALFPFIIVVIQGCHFYDRNLYSCLKLTLTDFTSTLSLPMTNTH